VPRWPHVSIDYRLPMGNGCHSAGRTRTMTIPMGDYAGTRHVSQRMARRHPTACFGQLGCLRVSTCRESMSGFAGTADGSVAHVDLNPPLGVGGSFPGSWTVAPGRRATHTRASSEVSFWTTWTNAPRVLLVRVAMAAATTNRMLLARSALWKPEVRAAGNVA
jgi:hypothetical protein